MARCVLSGLANIYVLVTMQRRGRFRQYANLIDRERAVDEKLAIRWTSGMLVLSRVVWSLSQSKVIDAIRSQLLYPKTCKWNSTSIWRTDSTPGIAALSPYQSCELPRARI